MHYASIVGYTGSMERYEPEMLKVFHGAASPGIPSMLSPLRVHEMYKRGLSYLFEALTVSS